jgi:hypothetical protein
MNDVTSFLAVTAAIFAAITVLLVLMSHLESNQADRDGEDGSSPDESTNQEATSGSASLSCVFQPVVFGGHNPRTPGVDVEPAKDWARLVPASQLFIISSTNADVRAS